MDEAKILSQEVEGALPESSEGKSMEQALKDRGTMAVAAQLDAKKNKLLFGIGLVVYVILLFAIFRKLPSNESLGTLGFSYLLLFSLQAPTVDDFDVLGPEQNLQVGMSQNPVRFSGGTLYLYTWVITFLFAANCLLSVLGVEMIRGFIR